MVICYGGTKKHRKVWVNGSEPVLLVYGGLKK